MKTFYKQELTQEADYFYLDQAEAAHAIKVLRCREGDQVNVVNGKGLAIEASIENIAANKCELRAISVFMQPQPEARIHIALANLKKRERTEWFFEKAVELGVHQISLYLSAHSEKKGMDTPRLERLAVSALKQSGNLWLPEISTGMTFKKLLANSREEQKIIAYCPTGQEKLLQRECVPGKDTLILIGPEGDFSDEEIRLATMNKCVPVSLGPLRLRAETAALAALVTWQIVNS